MSNLEDYLDQLEQDIARRNEIITQQQNRTVEILQKAQNMVPIPISDEPIPDSRPQTQQGEEPVRP